MNLSKAKTILIDQAQKRFPDTIISPCSKCDCLWNCFTTEKIEKRKLLFLWFNIGKYTFTETMEI